MRTITDLLEIKSQLPKGAIKAISNKSGIGYYTVLRIINGETRSIHLGEVLKATADFLTELSEKRKKR